MWRPPRAQRRHPRRRRRELTAADVVEILNAMPERWRAFFTMLAQTGVRIGELLGLTWRHVHLGDDPHVMVAEQVYRGRRKQLKTEASMARVPLAPTMAAWLTSLRPDSAHPDSPVFASARGTPIGYSNVYNRVLRPALRRAGIAVKVGKDEKGRDLWDFGAVQFGVANHCQRMSRSVDAQTGSCGRWVGAMPLAGWEPHESHRGPTGDPE
jgi:integrase